MDKVIAGRAVTPGMVGPEPERDGLLDRIVRSGQWNENRLDLAIEASGELVGEMDARRGRGTYPPGVVEIGIGLYHASMRGRGLGTEAVALLTRHLVEQEGAARVQASTADSNHAMRRCLEKAGFVYEGTMRDFMPGDGGRDDYWLYAVTRADLVRG
ncbi:MAG: GNAT family N-acetyltransferase [Actinomycetota bacterium]|nr:GNAT family N-acetyltransferase [Actinomycetota bacterium]